MDAISELYKEVLNKRFDSKLVVDYPKVNFFILKQKYINGLQKLPKLSR